MGTQEVTAWPDLVAFDNQTWPPYNWTSVSDHPPDGTHEALPSPTAPRPCNQSVFFFVVYGPLYGFTCLFGLLGNSLSFAVLHKYSRNNVATYLLKALAVMDNMFLVTAAGIQMYQAMAMYFGLTEQFKPVYPYLQTYAWPLAHMVQLGTVWMMVVIAANRFIAVCKPLHAHRLCSKRNVQTQLIIMASVVVLYNTPRFFEYRTTQVNITNEFNETVVQEVNTGLVSLHLYNILYENVAYCLFVFLIPLLILIVLNLHLVHDLKKAQRNRTAFKKGTGQRGGRSIEENNITLVMIIIIIVFIVCQLPAAVNQILFYVIDESERVACGVYVKYYHLCNLLVIMNSSVNFIIYCLFRRQFQQELVALLCKDRGGSRPMRKTVILRALHERTTSSYIKSTSQFSSTSHAMEDVPLNERLVNKDSISGFNSNHNHGINMHTNHVAL